MGGVSRSELVAAVTAAGGFGFLGMVREPPELIAREVELLRQLGYRRFGVNIIPAATDPVLLEHQVMTCIRLAVPVVGTFWDLNNRLIRRLRAAGILVVHQVGSVDEATAAESAGVEVIVVQGCEAGGHVRGVRPLRELLPDVAAAVKVPVLAAGGLATGRDLVTAMALGADGIVLGTAMLATDESFAHPHHKQRLLIAEADDTMLTKCFHINWPPSAPVRVLKSAVTSGARGDWRTTGRTVIGTEGDRPVYLFSTDSPLRSMIGDFESMALYAGTGVGQITGITGAGSRVRAIIAEADALTAVENITAGDKEFSSPVCYAHEIAGPYMGFFSAEDLSAELWSLADNMQTALRVLLLQEADQAAPSQPPFSDTAAEFAGWSLRLQRLAVTVGGGTFHVTNEIPLRRLETLDVSLMRGNLLRRLGAALPRMADQRVAEQLAPLLAFLRSQKLDSPRRDASHCSLETHRRLEKA
jgi:nitronate monooxygenase